jgi:hypothetical protein
MAGKRTKSREPLPPFVEPSFYFSNLSTHDALLAVVRHLVDKGSHIVYGTLGELGDADTIANLKFSFAERITVTDVNDLLSIHAKTGRAIVDVTLAEVGPGSADRNVIVRALSIPEAAVGTNRHPISIACDGRAFEPNVSPAQRKRAARDVMIFFTALVSALRPSYGAILFEYPLPCPYEVAERPDGFEFADCYLSKDYLDDSMTRHASNLRDNGQWLDIADGAIILTSGVFAEQPEVDGLPALAALAIVHVSATY